MVAGSVPGIQPGIKGKRYLADHFIQILTAYHRYKSADQRTHRASVLCLLRGRVKRAQGAYMARQERKCTMPTVPTRSAHKN